MDGKEKIDYSENRKSKNKHKDGYVNIRKKEFYKPIILRILNDFKDTFPSKYEYIDIQYNSETDFKDEDNDFVYDAELLYDNKSCKALNYRQLFEFVYGI